MTVSSQTNKVIYVGNGVAKEFAIPFSFLEQEHIKVRQKKNDIQTERTDWTVKSGNLVFADAPESGAEIAIVREVPLTQETDYRDNEILHAETLERNFDKLTMQVQQLAEKSARAVTVDIFSNDNPNNFVGEFKSAVTTAKNAAGTATVQAGIAAQQAKIATQAAARTDWIDIGSAQTITGIKTLKNVVIAETENVNFVAKNPTMDSAKVPSSPKYIGYDFRDKNNVRVGYIGIKQDSSGSFIYEIQTPNGLASAIHGITPASATENSKAMPTTAWIANQHKRGYGIGLPNYASPTTLSWGTSYTSATAPQVNGWLYFGGTSTDSDYLLLTMNGFTFNAGAISGAAGFHTLFIPYQAKTAFSTSGGTSGQFLKFFSSL